MRVKIRNARLSDIAQLRAMEERVWKETPATEEMLASRIQTFPEGNLIALFKGENKIVGYLSFIFIDYDFDNPVIKTWAEITDNGMCKGSHSLSNPVMFGVTMTVDESYQNKGIATRLMMAGWALIIRHNKKACLFGARCPDYHKYSKEMTVEEYVFKRRPDGQALDPEIRLYEREKFEFVTIVPNYIQDKESCNYGILMGRKLPLYGYPSFIRYPIASLIKRLGPRLFGW